jgi:hypothetical protein
MLTTLHGRLDLPDLTPFYSAFPELPLVSISDAQRQPMPPVNWISTVYHGLPKELLPFKERPEPGYLAFLGRISPEKGPERAIEIAEFAALGTNANDRRLVVRKDPRLGARLPTYRLTTRNNALIAAWLIVIE